MTVVIFVRRVMHCDVHHLLMHALYPTQPLGTNHNATCGSPINVIHHTQISHGAGDVAERLLQNRSRCQSSANYFPSARIWSWRGNRSRRSYPIFPLKPETEPPENFT